MARADKTQGALEDFVEMLRNVGDDRRRRAAAMDQMFWEYNNLNIGEFEDTDTRYARAVPERRAYPNAFLASSLGFNKSSMQSRYNEVLHKFGLERKPRVATLKNALHYERMKVLIIKYYDLLKK